MSESPENSPQSSRHRIDAIADKYEADLASGNSPVLSDYLQQLESADRAALFAELIELLVHYSNKKADSIDADGLIQQYPEYRSLIENAIGTFSPESDTPSIPDATMLLNSATQVAAASFQSDHSPTLDSSKGLTKGNVSAPAVGETVKYFGDYELIEEIARGGMGVVYKAKQTSLNRDVALKMILAGELAGEKDIQRFQLEAEAAGKLDHPGIVPVYEVGVHNDQHYFSMGFVDGGSLSEKLKDKPFEPRPAAELALKTARAVQYAHTNGVIHRDLKPANILIGSDGEPRITDFGLAKRVEQTSDLTMTGQVMGTPSYMPPEQASGLIDQISERADIYSLGGILYALLTGRPPFQAASTLDTLKQVIEVEPVAPRQLNAKIPRDIETIALKALDKIPSRRYQSAEEFGQDLVRFLNGEPINARPVGHIERTWRLAKRKPLAASLLTLASALALTILIGAPMFAIRESKLRDEADQQKADAVASRIDAQTSQKKAEQARNEAEKSQTLAERSQGEAEESQSQAESARDQAENAKQEAESARDELGIEKERSDRTLYARTVSLAYQDWQQGNVLRAETLLDRTDPIYRDWEFAFVKRLCHTDEQTLRGRGGAPSETRMHADKQHLVAVGGFNSGDHNFYVWNIETGTLKQKFDFVGLSISLDATLVAHLVDQSQQTMRITNVIDGKTVCEIKGHRSPIVYACFSHDTRLLATVGGDKRVRIWDVATGKLVTDIYEKNRRRLHQIHFSHDDSKVYWRTFEGWLQVFDVETGEQIAKHDVRNNHQMLFRCATSPDGETVAVCANDVIDIVRLDDGKIVNSLYGHAGPVTGVEYHPTEPRLVSCATDATVRVWDTKSGREILKLRGHKTAGTYSGVQAVSYSPDGSKIVSGGFDGTIKIWDSKANDDFSDDPLAVQKAAGPNSAKLVVVIPDPDQERDWLIGHSGLVWDAAFSQDGEHFATACGDGRVRVYDVATRRLMQYIGAFNYGVGAVAFHPGGKFLVMGEGGLQNTQGGTIQVIDRETGESVREIKGHDGPISGLKFNQDGSRLYSSSGSQQISHRGEFFCRDFETGEKIFELPSLSGVSSFDMSSDGKLIALTSYTGGIDIHAAETGEKLRAAKMQGQKAVFRSVAFSPDAKSIVAGANNWTVSMFDVETGNRIWQKDDHTGAAMEVNFHPDGQRVASVGLDGTLRIWDAKLGDVLLTMNEGGHELYGVHFSSDGKTMISHGQSSACWVRSVDQKTTGIRDGQEWEELLVDDFDRNELGDRWKIFAGEWSIDDGQARGVLASAAWEVGFYAATIIPEVFLPKVFEVECDFRAPKPMTLEFKVHDESVKNGLGSLFIGLPNAWNQRQTGSSIIAQVDGSFAEVARTNRGFEFEPDKMYRLKVIRDGKFWTSYVDGVEILKARVSANVHAPLLHLQGSFAEEGQEFYIDNVVVRAPKGLADDSAAIALDHSAHQKLRIPALMVDSLKANPNISDSVREKTLKLASKRKIDSDDRNQLIIQQFFAAALPAATRNEWADSLSIVWSAPQWKIVEKTLAEELAENPDEWLTRFHYSIVLYHLKKRDAALKEMQAADKSYYNLNGTNHLGRIAMEIIVGNDNDDQDAATKWNARLHEVQRSRYTESGPQEWIQLAESKVKPFEHDPEIETILADSFDEIEHLIVDADMDLAVRFYHTDAGFTFGRSDEPDEYDIQLGYDQWLKAEKIWNSGPPYLNTSAVRDRVNVKREGKELVVEEQFVAKFNFGFYRFNRVQRWAESEGRRQIVKERVNLIQQRFGDVITPKVAGDWSALDEKVAEARKNDDKFQLIAALFAAQRNVEALDVARELTELDPEATQAWSWRFLCGYSVHNAEEMQLSGEKAAELDPLVGGPVQLRIFATEAHSPKEPIDVGDGLTMRIPSFYQSGNRRDVNVPGKPLKLWYPTDTSLVSAFIIEGEGKDAIDVLKNVNEAEQIFKTGFGATTHRKKKKEIAGYKGFELVVQGPGNGRSMIRNGAREGTIQCWVGFLVGDDAYGFVLSSSPDEFNARFSELLTVLRTVAVDAKQK